ncbi:MAG: hypothetical protein RIQ81_1373 [Pseudomonadota bacterium]
MVRLAIETDFFSDISDMTVERTYSFRALWLVPWATYCFFLSGCEMFGTASVKPVIKHGPKLATLTDQIDIDRVAAIVPPDNSYVNKVTSSSLVVRGSCISGSFAVSIKIGDTGISAKLSCEEGSGGFSTVLDISSLPDGSVVVTMDFLNNLSSNSPVYTLQRTILKDTDSPATFSIPTTFTESSQRIQFPAVEGASAYKVTFTGPGDQVVTLESTSPSVIVSSLTVGVTWTVSVQAIDAAGNVTTSSNTGVFTKLDTDAPVFNSLGLAGDAADGYISDAEKDGSTALAGSLSASGYAVARYALSTAGSACSSATFGILIPTAIDITGGDGDYKVCVELKDAAGNTTYGATSTIVRDTSLPFVDAGTDLTYNSSSAQANSGATASGYATLSWSNQSTTTGVITFSNAATLTNTVLPDTDGTYTLRLTATDSAGNVAFAELTLTWTGLSGGGGGGGGSFTAMSTTNAPAGRIEHTAVLTSTEMIVWGGRDSGTPTPTRNDGGRFNLAAGTWTATSTGINVPSARSQHSAIWTGSNMIVWGGHNQVDTYYGDGAKYSPDTDMWSTISTTGAPTARRGHIAVWTGSRMILWGGESASGYVNDGARYNPSDDSWEAMAPPPLNFYGRMLAAYAWTGSKLYIWGGYGYNSDTSGNEYFDSGAIYDPSGNSWISMGGTPPTARSDASGVWTGSEFIVWGGRSSSTTMEGNGKKYNPNNTSWTDISNSGAPAGRIDHTTVWTGSAMLIYGGGTDSMYLKDGYAYNAAGNSWTSIGWGSGTWARGYATGVWDSAGNRALIWGGSEGSWYHNTGDIYTP